MSYISNQASVAQVQLSVQEITCKLSDTQVCSVSAQDLTIDLGQIVKEVRLFTFNDDSAETNNPRNASRLTYTPGTSTTVKIALGAVPTSADSFHMEYVIQPPAQS